VLRPYNLLENVLIDIENDIRKSINAGDLARKYKLSERHLRRLFRFAFKQPICSYIRSRKLTASLEDLLKTDANVLDVAVGNGFNYEQSYIRAFKREYGITPGEFRKNGQGQVIKVKPPLNLFDENKLSDGVLFDRLV
jgi:AraC family transcriptional regulator